MDRFNFEQDIFHCWHVVNDIKHLTEMISDRGSSTDDIVNVLIGIRILYNDRFQKLMDNFEYLIASDGFRNTNDYEDKGKTE